MSQMTWEEEEVLRSNSIDGHVTDDMFGANRPKSYELVDDWMNKGRS
jgi:hypothetical protein